MSKDVVAEPISVTIFFRDEGVEEMKATRYSLGQYGVFLNVWLFDENTLRSFHTNTIREVVITEIDGEAPAD